MAFPKAFVVSVLVATVLALDGVYQYTPAEIATLGVYNTLSNNTAPFDVYNENFLPILGSSPQLTNILNSTNDTFPQFHEAGILFTETPNPVLFITSNQYNISNSPDTDNKAISISRVSFNGTTWTAEIINPTGRGISLANGGSKYQDGIVFLDQGTLTKPGALVYMNATPPYATTLLIDNYYGQPFNSPNDIVVASDGALWFTDPTYGNLQGIRSQPQLPAQVYRFMPGTNDIRVVADGFVEPNGIAFSPDESTVYVTDGAGNSSALQAPRTIYALDVLSKAGQPYLGGKRVFAMPEKGIPDGIKTDAGGNVYAGCGDGVNVWDEGGVLLGKFKVKGGSSNFVLGTDKVWLLNELELFEASVGDVAVVGF